MLQYSLNSLLSSSLNHYWLIVGESVAKHHTNASFSSIVQDNRSIPPKNYKLTVNTKFWYQPYIFFVSLVFFFLPHGRNITLPIIEVKISFLFWLWFANSPFIVVILWVVLFLGQSPSRLMKRTYFRTNLPFLNMLWFIQLIYAKFIELFLGKNYDS